MGHAELFGPAHAQPPFTQPHVPSLYSQRMFDAHVTPASADVAAAHVVGQSGFGAQPPSGAGITCHALLMHVAVVLQSGLGALPYSQNKLPLHEPPLVGAVAGQTPGVHPC